MAQPLSPTALRMLKALGPLLFLCQLQLHRSMINLFTLEG